MFCENRKILNLFLCLHVAFNRLKAFGTNDMLNPAGVFNGGLFFHAQRYQPAGTQRVALVNP